MGRGLSKLQKHMLLLAAKIRQYRTDDWRDTVPDLLSSEVKRSYYGFCPRKEGYGEGGHVHLRSWNGGAVCDLQFSLDDPGYQATKAAIPRAIRRLRERGLVLDWDKDPYDITHGFYLTKEGWERANGLLEENSPQANH